MIELFQITGSASFAVRAALEEGGIAYETIDVHPRRRDDAPGFASANPLRRVPSIRDGDVIVYETGAVLLYLVERFPESHLGPQPGEPGRGALLRWVTWLADTLHAVWWPLQTPHHLTVDPEGEDGVRARGIERLNAAGTYLESELEGVEWCLGERFSVADIYLYMLTGWQSYNRDGTVLGGSNVQGHYERVGARAGVTRARALDDLDDSLQRFHPKLRAGNPL